MWIKINKEGGFLKLILYDRHGYPLVFNPVLKSKFSLQPNNLIDFFKKKSLFKRPNDHLIFALNKLSYETIIENKLYQNLKLEDLLTYLDLSSIEETIKIAMVLLSKKPTIVLESDDFVEKIQKFWIQVIKYIPLIDGETLKRLVRHFELNDPDVVYEILTKKETKKDFDNEFLLTLAIVFFNRIKENIKIKPIEIENIIKKGVKKSLISYRKDLIEFFEFFIKKNNEQILELIEKLVKTMIIKKTPREAEWMLLVPIYHKLIENLDKELSKDEKAELKNRLTKLLSIAEKLSGRSHVILDFATLILTKPSLYKLGYKNKIWKRIRKILNQDKFDDENVIVVKAMHTRYGYKDADVPAFIQKVLFQGKFSGKKGSFFRRLLSIEKYETIEELIKNFLQKGTFSDPEIDIFSEIIEKYGTKEDLSQLVNKIFLTGEFTYEKYKLLKSIIPKIKHKEMVFELAEKILLRDKLDIEEKFLFGDVIKHYPYKETSKLIKNIFEKKKGTDHWKNIFEMIKNQYQLEEDKLLENIFLTNVFDNEKYLFFLDVMQKSKIKSTEIHKLAKKILVKDKFKTEAIKNKMEELQKKLSKIVGESD